MQTHAVGHDINFSTLALQGDKTLSEINQLRDADPVYWSEQSQCWLITGHAEVTEGFAGHLPLSSTHIPLSLYRVIPQGELEARLPNAVKYMSQIITNMDGEVHARLRKLMIRAFHPKLIEGLRPFVRQRVAELLDNAQRLGEIEFHEGIARMLPGSVILKLLGMDQSYLPRLKGWADGVTGALTALGPDVALLDQLEVVVTDMLQVFGEEIAKRRENPGADFISYLLEAREEGDRLNDDEMLAALIMVIIAGHDTTSNSLTLGVRALAQHPDAWEAWHRTPERKVDYAVELMRYMAMSTCIPRIVAEDFEWHGRHLKAGQVLMLVIAGGNRDPSEYSDPEVLDFARRNDRALTFGPGLHHCIGHLLAKLQLSEFFTALVERFERVEIVEEPEFLPAIVFRTVAGLQTRFHPR